MRLFLAGSAPLLPETFDAWRERTGHTIVERYGMSETVMLTSNPYRREDGERRAGTVGMPLPGVQLRVQDDKGQPCRTRRNRRHRGQGPERLQGLLAHAGKDGRRVHARPAGSRPATSARSTSTACQHRRPQQGPDHQRRLQRLSGRDRGPAQRACPAWPKAPWSACRTPTSAKPWWRWWWPSRAPALDSAALIATLKTPDRQLQGAQAGLHRNRAAAQPMGKVQKNLLRERFKGLFCA